MPLPEINLENILKEANFAELSSSRISARRLSYGDIISTSAPNAYYIQTQYNPNKVWSPLTVVTYENQWTIKGLKLYRLQARDIERAASVVHTSLDERNIIIRNQLHLDERKPHLRGREALQYLQRLTKRFARIRRTYPNGVDTGR